MKLKKSYIHGQIKANPSKSHEQRLILAALLAEGTTILHNTGCSDDVITARQIAADFGAQIVEESDKITIKGGIKPYPVVKCNESGLCARLFTPPACLVNDSFRIEGEKTLLKRPISSGFEILEQMGSKYSSNNGLLPITFSKASLTSGIYEIENNVTSQLNSGLIMSLPLLRDGSKIIIHNPVSLPYILLSLEVMRDFGIKINHRISNNKIIVSFSGNQKYNASEKHVEGDWSSSVFPLCAAAINGDITVSGLNLNSVQADKAILKVFELAKIKFTTENKSVHVSKSNIMPFRFNASDCPDLIPALMVLAIFAQGESVISGARRLIFKESSRVIVMQSELSKAGIKIEICDDLILIKGGQQAHATEFDANGDHRIAMALGILSLNIDEYSKIKDYDCVNKSYPYFFEDIIKLGANFSAS